MMSLTGKRYAWFGKRIRLGLIFAAAWAFAAFTAAAQEEFAVSKGPFLQKPGTTSMVVGFELSNPGTGSVEVRKDGDNQASSVIVASSEPARIHHILIGGLEPDTKYRYRVLASRTDGGAGEKAASGEYVFRTMPSGREEFSFAVLGDNRTQVEVFAKLCETLAGETRPEPEFVLHTGDLLADGREYEQWQEQFFTPASAWLPRKPLFPVLGNHERDAKFYYDIFDLPGNESYYSFEYANALFLMINSCKPVDGGSEQYAWIEKTLAEKAGKYKWKFAVFHHPPYSSGPHNRLDDSGRVKEQPARDGQDFLEPLFNTYGVHAVFNGHDHIYERSRKSDTYYIVAGGGGAPLYKRSETAERQNPYSELFASVHSYVLVSVFGDRLLFQAIDIDGRIFDAFSILTGEE